MNTTPQYCEFCDLYNKKDQNGLVIAQDQQFFAFHDLNLATSQAHILVCTKEHIESAIQVKDPSILDKMEKFGGKLMRTLHLQKFGRQADQDDIRMGFHLPPYISVFHIHLHCFLLPIKNRMYNQYLYGFGLHPAAKIKQKLSKDKKTTKGKL